MLASSLAYVLRSQDEGGSTPFIPLFIHAWTCYIQPDQRTGAANQNNPASHFPHVIVATVYSFQSRTQGRLPWISPGRGRFLATHKGPGPAPVSTTGRFQELQWNKEATSWVNHETWVCSISVTTPEHSHQQRSGRLCAKGCTVLNRAAMG